MKLTATKKNSANGKIELFVSKDVLDTKAKKIAAKIAKNIKLDGFRKGKVPPVIVEKRYGKEIAEDARQEVLDEAFAEGLKEIGVSEREIVGQPLVTKFEEKDGGIEAEISFSLRPEISFDNIDELIPEFDEVEVEEREVLERIVAMARAMAPLENCEGSRLAQKGDFLTIDLVGTIDGVEFAGGKASDMVVELGGGRFLPDFEKNFEKMKVGDEKEFEFTFPEDYSNKELAGKTAMFKVVLKAIQVKPDIVVDEELAKKMMPQDAEASLEKLKNIVKTQLKNEKTAKLFAEELKPQLIESLVGRYSFDLPEIIVEQEIDLMLRNKLGSMSEDEIKALRDAKEKIDAMREEMRAEAERRVKATFLIDELAKREGISVHDNELVEAIFYEAVNMGTEPKALLEYYQRQGLLPAVKMAMIEDKLLTHLLNKKKADKQ